MPDLTISIEQEHLAHLTAVARRHDITPELLAASIVQSTLQGEDTRREIRRLRVDLATITQMLVLHTGLAGRNVSEDEAWEWAEKHLLQNPWP